MNISRIQWICGAIAVFLAVAASANPPTYKFSNRTYGNSVDGGRCSGSYPGVYRCRSVHVWENYDVKGTYEYTEVYYQNERHEYDPSDGSYDDRWRYIICPIDEKSIAAHPNRVTIEVAIDGDDPACYQYGYRYGWNPTDGNYSEPWGFTGIWTIQGEWLDPFNYGSSVWNQKDKYYDGWSNTTSQGLHHCNSRWGDLMTSGGWSVATPAGRTFFYEFDGPYGLSWSFYNVSSCNDKDMQK